MTLTIDEKDKLHDIYKQIDFMSAMVLAWDTDSIEFGDTAKEGVWFMLECVRKDLLPFMQR